MAEGGTGGRGCQQTKSKSKRKTNWHAPQVHEQKKGVACAREKWGGGSYIPAERHGQWEEKKEKEKKEKQTKRGIQGGKGVHPGEGEGEKTHSW